MTHDEFLRYYKEQGGKEDIDFNFYTNHIEPVYVINEQISKPAFAALVVRKGTSYFPMLSESAKKVLGLLNKQTSLRSKLSGENQEYKQNTDSLRKKQTVLDQKHVEAVQRINHDLEIVNTHLSQYMSSLSQFYN